MNKLLEMVTGTGQGISWCSVKGHLPNTVCFPLLLTAVLQLGISSAPALGNTLELKVEA
jgi:hypothetical protein